MDVSFVDWNGVVVAAGSGQCDIAGCRDRAGLLQKIEGCKMQIHEARFDSRNGKVGRERSD